MHRFSQFFRSRVYQHFYQSSQHVSLRFLSSSTYFSGKQLLPSFALATATLGMVSFTISQPECEQVAAGGEPSKSIKYLTNYSIADAAAVILPCVVNIVSHQGGFLPLTSAGSGFIISKVSSFYL
jgi:S1-C subfamily serine protease